MFSVELFQDLFDHLLMHCKDNQANLQNQCHANVVEALLRVMHEFLLFKANLQYKESGDNVGEPNSVSMFYLAGVPVTEGQ